MVVDVVELFRFTTAVNVIWPLIGVDEDEALIVTDVTVVVLEPPPQAERPKQPNTTKRDNASSEGAERKFPRRAGRARRDSTGRLGVHVIAILDCRFDIVQSHPHRLRAIHLIADGGEKVPNYRAGKRCRTALTRPAPSHRKTMKE